MTKVNFINYLDKVQDDKKDIISGLSDFKQKRLNSKFFYENGSKLFDQITEVSIIIQLKRNGNFDKKNKKIKKELPAGSSIIEFGAGSNKKIRKLLKILDSLSEYISIDISRNYLLENSKKLAEEFPNLKITAISADFNHKLNSIK